jgi:hypothetical protein
VRPAYKSMIQRVELGEFDVLLSYSNSRLTRRPLELEDLIDLHQRTGIRICTIVSGDDDLSTADGRMTARIKANVDAAEAERIGERVSRKARQRKEQGLRSGGFPPYGYRNADGGKLEIDPERADVVREAARRILAGESLYGLWTDFNRRGITTAPSPKAPKGARWHARTLKRVLTVPATIGCIETDAGVRLPVAEPILDRDVWDRLREVLYEPSRFTETRKPDWSNRRKYPLSGLLFCGLCGHWLSGAIRSATKTKSGEVKPKVQSFACATANGGCGRVRIDYRAVEDWIVRQALALVAVPAVQTSLAAREQPDDVEPLRRAIIDDERLLQRLDDDHTDGLLDRPRYVRQVERVTLRLDAARARLAESQRGIFVIDTGGRSLRDAWDEHASDTPWRRRFLEQVIERVTISPHPVGMTSTITRRRGETDEDFGTRRRDHLHGLLLRRVRIDWRHEALPTGAPDVDMAALDHLSHAEMTALWLSRMHANRPVQLTDPAVIEDVAALVQARRPSNKE